MSKRQQRIRNRKSRLVELAIQGLIHCTKHNNSISPITVLNKRCYTGRRGKTYCKYLRGYDGQS